MTDPSNKLAKYRKMRSKDKTPEPFTSNDTDSNKLFFVVQRHQATALHYDFRLEVGKTMPSWAVPKGPSLDNSLKRLAMQTEDHPLDYRKFKGVIPKGQYGAGIVEIWDEGTYYPEVEIEKGIRRQIKDKTEGEKMMEESLSAGEIKFFLNGKKLKGSFALIKTRGFAGRNAWLLIKHKDEFVKPGFEAKDY